MQLNHSKKINQYTIISILVYFTMFPVIYKNHKVKDFNYILLLYMSVKNIPNAQMSLPIEGWERIIGLLTFGVGKG